MGFLVVLPFIMKGRMFMKECEVVLEDCMVPNLEEQRSNVFVIKMNMQIPNKKYNCSGP